MDGNTAQNWPDEPASSEVMENASDHWQDSDHWDAWETMDERPGLPASGASSVPSALPLLPTRSEQEAPPSPAAAALASRQRSGDKDKTSQPQQQQQQRLQLRLFGKSAAHTLEVTDHRRGDDFMGTHVVSIDSAAAHGTGGTYAWERKLVIIYFIR